MTPLQRALYRTSLVVIAALAAAPNGVLTTAQAGDVTLRTDGASWWVETER